MEFHSPTFFIFFLVSMVLYHWRSGIAQRENILLMANAVFVGSFASSFWSVVPLLGFVLLGYGFIHWIRVVPRQSLMLSLIGVLVVLFLYLKNYFNLDGLPTPPFAFLLIGLSYILFRILHLIIDWQSGALSGGISLRSYLNYIFFFLNFVSGPIQRYQDFKEQLHGPGLVGITRDEVFAALSRIINGFFKVYYLSVLFLEVHQNNWLFAQVIRVDFLTLIRDCSLGIASYTIYMYFNFSGYMDIVLGFGRLLGFKLPENFNDPFWADNFLDLWSRWHITLSEWFKFYFFNPLLKMLKLWITSKALGPYLGVFCFFFTFLVLGIWHGSGMIFVLEGLLLGGGASVNKLYQLQIKKWLHKATYNRLKQSLSYRYLCRGMTFSYASIVLICLYLNPEQLERLRSLGVIMGVTFLSGSYLVMTVAIVLVMWALDQVMGWPVIRYGNARIMQSVVVGHLWLSIKLVALISALILLEHAAAPQFIYQGF